MSIVYPFTAPEQIELARGLLAPGRRVAYVGGATPPLELSDSGDLKAFVTQQIQEEAITKTDLLTGSVLYSTVGAPQIVLSFNWSTPLLSVLQLMIDWRVWNGIGYLGGSSTGDIHVWVNLNGDTAYERRYRTPVWGTGSDEVAETDAFPTPMRFAIAPGVTTVELRTQKFAGSGTNARVSAQVLAIETRR